MKKQQQPKKKAVTISTAEIAHKIPYTGPHLRQTIVRCINAFFKWALPQNAAHDIFNNACAAGAIEQAGDVNGVPLYIFTEKPYICDVHGVEIPEKETE
jgi:hypothetical protein